MINKFNLEGFYTQSVDPRKCSNSLIGKIEIADDGYFECAVVDTALIEIQNTIERVLAGHIRTEGDLDKLFFLKLGGKYDFANSIYDLNKPANGSLEGKYIGTWGPSSFIKSRGFSKKHFLFIPQVDDNRFPFTNYTEINLYKK